MSVDKEEIVVPVAESTANGKIILEWKNLQFTAAEKVILREQSCTLHKGELVAILGPSGAGKTTLLSCIAGRTMATSGEMFLQGKSRRNN